MSQKRKRSCNFTAIEVETLVSLVIENQNIIECKKTDYLTNSEKELCWENIAELFNNTTASGRCKDSLKSKWDSLKKTTRKSYSNHKRVLKQTGFGPFKPNNLGTIEKKVLGVIGVNGIDTLSRNDCDADDLLEPQITFDENLNISDTTQNHQTEFVSVILKKEQDWEDTDPVVLRQENHAALRISEEPVQEEMNVATKNVQLPYRRKRKGKQTEMGIYRQLVQNKIKYIDFQTKLLKEEHEARMRRDEEKHKLEIKILQQDLLNKTRINK